MASTISSARLKTSMLPLVVPADDDEDDEAEHVVEHGRGEDDAHGAALAVPQFAERAHGDADRRGGERGRHEQRRPRPPAEEQPDQGAGDEGEERAEHGDLDGRDPRLHQLVHVGLEAGHEQQHDDAQLGHGVHDLARVDQSQQLRPQDGAGEELADHDGQLEALEQVPEQARAGEGEEEHEQRVGVS